MTLRILITPGSRWASLVRSSYYGRTSRCCFSSSAETSAIEGPTCMELFAGIGCFGMAARKRRLTCVYTNENNRHSIKTYEMNHCGRAPGISKVDSRGFEQVVEDVIRQVVEQVTDTAGPSSSPPPRATVLFAGFPCQPFSNSGKRQGLDCQKNGHHLYDILKLLICLRNPIVVLENVKPFAENKDFGAREVVYKEFEELGYHVSRHVYKAVDFNLPQNRERLFIVAVRKDLATAPFKCEPTRAPYPFSLVPPDGVGSRYLFEPAGRRACDGARGSPCSHCTPQRLTLTHRHSPRSTQPPATSCLDRVSRPPQGA